MKKTIFLILIFSILLTFPVFAAEGEPASELSVSEEERAIEHIEDTNGFTNFVDIVSDYKYFCYFRDGGSYYLAVFNQDGFAVANQIRAFEDGLLYFWLGWDSVGFYIASDLNLTFTEVDANYLSTGCFSERSLQDKFASFDGVTNFNLSKGGRVLVAANLLDYSEEVVPQVTVPQVTFPLIENPYSEDGSLLLDDSYNALTSFSSEIIYPFFSALGSYNIITYILVAGLFGFLLFSLFRVFANG